MPLTSTLQITDKSISNKSQNTQAKNQDILSAVGRAHSDKISRSIKNLSIIANLANSKISKSIKSKKSDLLKANFVKANSSETDFLTPKAKKTFIYLQKTFTKAPILRHFNSDCHIPIETDVLRYVISEVLS